MWVSGSGSTFKVHQNMIEIVFQKGTFFDETITGTVIILVKEHCLIL